MVPRHPATAHRARLALPRRAADAGLRLDRRAFLLGSAGVVLLAACGDDGDDTASDRSATTAAGASTTAVEDITVDESTINLGQLFDPSPGYTRVGEEQRLTWGLFDFQGPLADPPAELTFQLFAGGGSKDGGEAVGDPIVAPYRDEGLPRGYYAFRFTPDRTGPWFAETRVRDQDVYGVFEVAEAGTEGVIAVGADMPELETATVEDPLGVDPLCTRETQCPFHDLAFEEARAAAKPIVLSISTPAYCQVAICGPVLDLLVDVSADYPDLQFIHVEPYQAPVPGDPFTGGITQPMEALGLQFEPSLMLVNADGTLSQRLDNIYDLSELRESLDALSAGTA